MPRLRRGVGEGKESTVVAPEASAARTKADPPGSSGGSTSVIVIGEKKRIVSENVKTDSKVVAATKRASPEAAMEKGRERVKRPRTKFPVRLQWKMKNCRMPPTSTPKRDPRSHTVTEYDIETAFGFDESADPVADYSTLLSPIAHASPKDAIVPPVWKVHPLSQRNTDRTPPAPPTSGPPLKQHLRKVRDNGVDAQERRSPRFRKHEEVRVIQISPRPPPPAATATATSVKQSTVEIVPSTKKDEMPVTYDDIGLPDEITLPVPTPPKPSVVTSTQAEAKTVTAPAKQTTSAASAGKPTRGRGRPKKQVVGPTIKPKETEPDQPKPTRTTRSRKAAAAPPIEVESSGPAKPSSSTSSRVTRPRRAAAVKVVAEIPTLSLAEADDEDDDVVEVIPVKKTTVKSKPKSIKKSIPDSAPVRVPSSSKTLASMPLHLTKKQHLLDSKPAVTEQSNQEPHRSSPFSQLLNRIHEEDEPLIADQDELHVDPRKILKTYGSRKRVAYSEDRDPETEYDFIPRPTTADHHPEEVVIIGGSTPAKSKATKSKRKVTKHKKAQDEDADEEMRKWLEEKNKEFNEVENTKLVIEQSFSD